MKKLTIIMILMLGCFVNIDAANYKVTVKRLGNNLYKDINSGAIIKTSLCLELALGEEAILKWDCAINSEMFGCGKLIFLESGETCQVDAVYD